MGVFHWSRFRLVLPDRWYWNRSWGQRHNMPLLKHLICQGHNMVRAACRRVDQTPSKISKAHGVIQNKVLEKIHIITFKWAHIIRPAQSLSYALRWRLTLFARLRLSFQFMKCLRCWNQISPVWELSLVRYAYKFSTKGAINQSSLFDLCLNSCRGSKNTSQLWQQMQHDIKVSAFSGSVTQSPLSLSPCAGPHTVW